MPLNLLDLGSVADDRTGDNWRAGGQKINDMFTELFGIGTPTERVIVNELADLPNPVSNQITLAADKQYLFGDSFSLGTNQIIMSSGTVVEGLDENVIELTYTGSGIMFTAEDATSRIKSICCKCTSGTFLNASNTAGNEGTSIVVLDNVDVQTATLGTIGNLAAFGAFRCAYNSITTDGWSFTGTQGGAIVFQNNIISISNGTYIDLGTASFQSITIDGFTFNGSAGTTMLSGTTASGNVRTGGIASVTGGRNLGSETPLSGITVDDDLWEFDLNNKIRDSRPDALISMQNNATETVITVAGTPVKVAGTWVVEATSQMTADNTGKITTSLGKDARLPITYSVSCEPVSGTNISLSAFVAVDGTVVTNSERAGAASSGSPASITVPWQETFVAATPTFVEVFVTNNDTTSNVIVSSAVGRVN
jgi:hypothetical protein